MSLFLALFRHGRVCRRRPLSGHSGSRRSVDDDCNEGPLLARSGHSSENTLRGYTEGSVASQLRKAAAVSFVHVLKQPTGISKAGGLRYESTETLITPTSGGLAQEAGMISTLSSALSMQSSSHTDMDRLSSKRRFVNLDLDRSRASRHRHRVLSSARKMAALFYHEIKDRQSRH